MNISDSIPDILQTITSSSHTNSAAQANVFVNELSALEADLVDLASPEQEKVSRLLIKECFDENERLVLNRAC